MDDLLLEIENLQTFFFLDEGVVKAVDGASLKVRRGKTLAVVGESGCGKSVMARSVLQIVAPPGRVVGGTMRYYQHTKSGVTMIDLSRLGPDSRAMRGFRGQEVAMIFQEPMSSLSPVHTIGSQIMENFVQHFAVSKREGRDVSIEMLRKVGIPRAEERFDAYPHQLSGGMRQRAMIAMALICQPSLLIADEPTTALDVTTQAQILDLMLQLQQELGMAIMIITHDLGVVAEIADDVAVMYLGEVVEQAPVDDIFHRPQHPYTRGLLRSIPRLESATHERLDTIPGAVPHPFARPPACRFQPRCRECAERNLAICSEQVPDLIQLDAARSVRCWLYDDRRMTKDQGPGTKDDSVPAMSQITE